MTTPDFSALDNCDACRNGNCDACLGTTDWCPHNCAWLDNTSETP